MDGSSRLLPISVGRTSPVCRFLAALDAVEDPEVARETANGLYQVEIFPALAVASLRIGFFGRLRCCTTQWDTM